MFESVLIANRGEIALRIQRTLRRLGIESIAVFSDADAQAPHVRSADRAVRIGPAPASESYLHIERVLAASQATGAQAVHPGYGFLSERADFAAACRDAGLAFIGPSPEALALLGDKAAAKRAAATAGVPVVPGLSPQAPDLAGCDEDSLSNAAGCGEGTLSDEQIVDWAASQPLPLLLKAAGGGGGRGMRVVSSLDELPQAILAARREARSAFGDERLIVERLIERARHIEMQVIADAHHSVLHLGERECSLQRRHQKVIEEAPSPVVGPELRARMGQAAVALARACGYTGAGTVELIADRDDPQSFFFLEMNARLQVEHPVTEAVTGLDLVELQLRVAAGEPLRLTQEQVQMQGHAIEARIYAEDPASGFMPSTGRIAVYREPSEIRFDSGVAACSTVATHYDPMLAKAIAHEPDRRSALARLQRALEQTRILGPTTNLPWLIALLRRPEVQEGALDTTLLERIGAELRISPRDDRQLACIALVAMLSGPHGDDPWHASDGWSLLGRGEAWMRLAGPNGEVEATAIPEGDHTWKVGEMRVRARVAGESTRAAAWQELGLTIEGADGVAHTLDAYRDGEAIWLVEEGLPLRFAPVQERAAHHAGIDSLQAPMPGVVLEVRTQAGSEVGEGEVLVVIESMKMEMGVASPETGVVSAVHVAAGDRVSQGQALLELEGA